MADNIVNYQNWMGMDDKKFGYGGMRRGFLDHAPEGVLFDARASSSVYFGLPDTCPGFLEGSYKVLSTMWETDMLPDRWIRFLPEYDKIVVPCEHNRKLFAKHHANVVMVPLGVDHSVWFPKADKVPNAKFRFACGGSLWMRKGLDIALRAFTSLDIDAELHIKVAPHCADQPAVSMDPRIIYHYRWLPEAELVAWTQQTDCWVAPSRGEGWGMQALQAMACGIPTILSNTSGHREYQHLATSVIPTYLADSPSGGAWDETSPDRLADEMLNVYENAVDARSEALLRVGDVHEFSWENASKRLVDALPVGVLVEGVKVVPVQPLVTIKVKQSVSPNVAGKQYTFIPGVPYSVPDEVERVLSESGYLV